MKKKNQKKQKKQKNDYSEIVYCHGYSNFIIRVNNILYSYNSGDGSKKWEVNLTDSNKLAPVEKKTE